MKENRIHLPKTVGNWTRNDIPKLVDATNIFDYMDGAGELYLGYRFDHLEVYEYQTDDSLNSILVELYFMKTSDDAFGLLSLDWGGESIDFDNSAIDSVPNIAPSIRALYGGGLLRIWSADLYVRIMAYRDTPELKDAVIILGRSITSNRENPPQPSFLSVLPTVLASDWVLRRDRIGYFRSYLVFNSLYYVSHQNILDLDHSVEAVSAAYEKERDGLEHQRIQILFINYDTDSKAQKALRHFIGSYLPEHESSEVQISRTESINFYKIEDGWLGYKLEGKYLAILFQCPDEKCAREIINQISFN